MTKAPSQNAIGRELGLSSAAMVKLKKQGCPMTSVEAVRAWRSERQNIAQRKPEPVAAPSGPSLENFFPAQLPPADLPPWSGGLDEDEGTGFGMTGSDESFERARIRHKIAEANLAELEEARIKGLHVEKVKVDLGFFEAARGLRDGMTNCSRRLAAEVATLTTPGECEAVISKELRHLLESFTRQLTQKLNMPPAEGPTP